jgi:hypothetical protein
MEKGGASTPPKSIECQLTAHEQAMPDVDEPPQDSNRLAVFEASLDALARAPAPLRPPPYPGDHPCEIAGCGCNAPFGFNAIPRRVWFCKKHMEEIPWLTPPPQPIPSKSFEPSVGAAPTAGRPANGMKSETQLTLFSNGPTNTGS